MRRAIMLLSCLTLLLGISRTLAISARHKKIVPLSASEVVKILDHAGIPAKSAKLLHRERIGRPPQVPRDVCFYRVEWKDASWLVGVDTKTRQIVRLWGQVAFLAWDKPKPIDRYEHAVQVADLWFKRFGVQIQTTRGGQCALECACGR